MNPLKNTCMPSENPCSKNCRFIYSGFEYGKKDNGANVFCPYEWQCTLNYPGRYD